MERWSIGDPNGTTGLQMERWKDGVPNGTRERWCSKWNDGVTNRLMERWGSKWNNGVPNGLMEQLGSKWNDRVPNGTLFMVNDGERTCMVIDFTEDNWLLFPPEFCRRSPTCLVQYTTARLCFDCQRIGRLCIDWDNCSWPWCCSKFVGKEELGEGGN